MTALEFLERITLAERNLEAARDREERYRCSMQRITSSLGGEHVSHSRNVTAQEDAIIRYMEAVEESNRLEIEKNSIIDAVENAISHVKRDDFKIILRRIYIKHESVEDIAKDLFLHPKYVFSKRKMALHELDQYLAKSPY